MGWWKEKDMTIGDEPIDLFRLCLEDVINSYEKDLGKKPTVEEILQCLTHVFSLFGRIALPDLGDREVTSILIRTKKLGKVQKYGVGDCFAIPVKKGFRYGRIIQETSAGQLIEIIDLHTDHLLTFPQFLEKAKKVITWKHVNDIIAFHNRRWRIIGKLEIPKTFEYPRFYVGSKYGFFKIVQGNEENVVNVQDLAGIEPVIMFGPQYIEEMLSANVKDPWPDVKIGMVIEGVVPEDPWPEVKRAMVMEGVVPEDI